MKNMLTLTPMHQTGTICHRIEGNRFDPAVLGTLT